MVSDTESLAHAVVTTGLPVRGRAVTSSGVELLTRLSPDIRDVRRCGSAAIELCMVADGTYDVYLARELSPWDTCAGAAILLAAGGRWEPWRAAVPVAASDTGQSYELGCNQALYASVRSRLAHD